MTNAVCETLNKSWVVIYECRLRAISRNKTTFNFNGSYVQPANDVTQEIRVFKKASGYKPWVIKRIVIDFCQFLRKPYHPYALVVNKIFEEFSNINYTCPHVGPIIVKDLYPKHYLFKLPLPTGDYLLTLNWLLDKRPQFFTNVYFTFTEN
ncbi:hypothetical protein KR044_008029 [Drosophila immigrans]|nr:hypothetical protein KR044_008029 [Drosophila immigrans]